MRAWLSMAGLLACGFGAYHRTPLSVPGTAGTNLPPDLIRTNSAIVRISDSVLALGLVQVDKQARTIHFPAAVNMVEGNVEYAVVHSSGKVHESVLRTEANPLHIHLAELLLSPDTAASGDSKPQPAARTPAELLGPRVELWVKWGIGGAEYRVRIETLVSNTVLRARMSTGDWAYNGSRVVEGTFIAQRDGSIAAIIADPDALINNPRAGRDDDEIWKVNQGAVPALGTSVEVIIQLPK